MVDCLQAHGQANWCATANSVPTAEQVMAALDPIHSRFRASDDDTDRNG